MQWYRDAGRVRTVVVAGWLLGIVSWLVRRLEVAMAYIWYSDRAFLMELGLL